MDNIEKPVIEYPNWLPNEIRKAVNQYIEQRFLHAKRYQKSLPTYWTNELYNIKQISKAFTNENVKTTWPKLLEKSEEKTIKFVTALFRINHEYDFEYETVESFNKEKQSYIDIYNKCQTLMDDIYKHNSDYDGGLLDDCYQDLMLILEKFLTRPHKHFYDFQEYAEQSSKKENSLLALSRKKNIKNAKAIYFSRRISAFFRTEFEKPMNYEVGSFVNAIFEVEYYEDEIKKITKDVKRILEKREHSAA